ncbi:MAG: hypothetical protein CVU08_04735 [Bacteroidetes bacterium HGW-Bacteroidetes-3]|jgi:hypothetical protein|nr:MAG: hypothetical protein CVU08_04735 [Bacteroidetes bacterium HGW-Bacteroidetes-3]
MIFVIILNINRDFKQILIFQKIRSENNDHIEDVNLLFSIKKIKKYQKICLNIFVNLPFIKSK